MMTTATTAPLLIDGEWRASIDATATFTAFDPRSGAAIGPRFPVSGPRDVETALAAASAIAPVLAATPADRIAAFLDAYADGIDAAADELVALAHAETALPVSPRLSANELPRTSNQLRQAADAARSHAWTQPVIDTKNGLRAHLAPLGKPVLVFGPNNFPLAFNAIAGSDFASAIAARNPVIAKAHPSHPATSARLARIAHQALLASGLPAASVQLLHDIDRDVGIALCGDRRIGAIGFTGSRAGGLALKAAADRAGTPFFAELSSVNPVFLLDGVLTERGEALAGEFFASCTLGSGQFCTNPGLLVVPRSPQGDAFVAAAAKHFGSAEAKVLFSDDVARHFDASIATLIDAGAQVIAQGSAGDDRGFHRATCLLSVDARPFIESADALQTEAFGPASLIVRVANIDEVIAVARALDGNLTGSIFSSDDGSDDGAWQRITSELRPRVGRLIANQWPTGVAVSPAMQHGGPFPSASHAGHTSVGMPAAITRFTARHGYQNVRDDRLPIELQNANPAGVLRVVDGEWTTQAIDR